MDALERDLRRHVRGEVRFDAGTRAIYAHDASNYRQPPIAVVAPRDPDDAATAIAVCRRHHAPVLGRGGGTSLAGQCVNHAVVLDYSKYVDRVVDVDPDGRRARVQPGCVLDQLRDACGRHGLTFGPDPATHNRCTVGGMLGNNSCGVHSVLGELYGCGAQTADHVEELEILTYDGLRLRVGATSEEELARIVAAGGRRGEIYRRLRDLRDRHADRIRARYVDMPRRVSGYNLDHLLPERGFHVARALVGSESTCVTILEATLTIYPARPARVLCVLGYPSVFEAGDHVPEIRRFGPIGLEGMDRRLVDQMRDSGLHVDDLALLPDGAGWLLVEFGADTVEDAEAQARRMVDALGARRDAPSIAVLTDRDEMHKVWVIRESGLAATAFVTEGGDAWPGWEDTAVPPDRIGPYLRDLRRLLDEHGFDCSLYGHFGQGCVHTRVPFDLGTPGGRERYRAFTDAAADLVVRYGGALSGEHGDGIARADLLVREFGEELIGAFREFKAIWDPDARMNPGRIVDAPPRTEHLKLAVYQPPRQATQFAYPEDDGDFRHAAVRCVGVGECRKHDHGTMCPSYMVTREEKHTTRGRARILFEMLEGEVIRDGWASEEVEDALDLCLACKGCKGECPVHVDMATYKAEFLHRYYRHHWRPRHAYAFGWIHRWARIASRVPSLANLVTQTPGLRRIAAWAAGAAPQRPIPRFAEVVFSRAFARRPAPDPSAPPVVLWPDTFNNHFFPQTLLAAAEVLEAAGYRVVVPSRPVCCGRPLYDYGMLPLARRLWERTMDVLGEHVEAGTPVVGLEPSCVSAFRDELPNLFRDDRRAIRLARQTKTFAELLVERDLPLPRAAGKVVVHGHCHDKAILGFDAERRVYEGLGLDVDVVDSGCCGLAGSFGFEAEHYDLSMAIGERALLPAVRGAGDAIVASDGFSCREQILHGTGRDAYHLAEIVYAASRRASASRSARPSPGRLASHTSAPSARAGAPSNRMPSMRR